MRYDDAIKKHGGRDKLTGYEKGWIDGVFAFAHMKDGQNYVGTTGKLLGDAVDEFLSERYAYIAENLEAK